MNYSIKKVVVLGSGAMGGSIAAYFTNLGISCLLLDMPSNDEADRNALVRKGFNNVLLAKPDPFYSKSSAKLIELGNFDDDLDKIGDCDLIIEAIVENLDVKKEFWKKIDAYRRPDTIVASNTSSLSINSIVADCSEDLKRHFVGMHFFNPPRYLRLLELTPCKETNRETLDFIISFAENGLGKSVIVCNDTPGFVANRIFAYSSCYAMQLMVENGFTIQEVDTMLGPVIGNSKSAVFRTADIAGIDVSLFVTENMYNVLEDDDEREIFKLPQFVSELVDAGSLGIKSGKGFYQKRKDGSILYYDYIKKEYVPKQKLNFTSIALARGKNNVYDRIRTVLETNDKASEFIWKYISSTFLYCCKLLGVVSDSLYDMDNALKSGYMLEAGPFEQIDAIGIENAIKKLNVENRKIPNFINEFINMGNSSFYSIKDDSLCVFDFKNKVFSNVYKDKKIIILKSFKDRNKTIISNNDASLIDLDDEVACLEFHSKMNAIGDGIISLTKKALTHVENNCKGLVIANQDHRAFSAGANIMLLLMEIMEGEWDEIDLMIRRFQTMNMSFKYLSKPVVVVPHGLTLGAGCEIMLHADRVTAFAESYIGLVESGVGLIPAGGGTKEMLVRAMENVPDSAIKIVFIEKIMETIGMARISSCAENASEIGFLRPTDSIVINRDYLIYGAKESVINMYESNYAKPRHNERIPVLGKGGLAVIKAKMKNMLQGGFISDHDYTVIEKLGYVLTGGNLTYEQNVNEQYLLDLEREAFLSLCGMRKTQERLKYMLDNGKPLRN